MPLNTRERLIPRKYLPIYQKYLKEKIIWRNKQINLAREFWITGNGCLPKLFEGK